MTTPTEAIVARVYTDAILDTIPSPLRGPWSRAEHHDEVVVLTAKRCGLSEERVREVVDDS